MEARKQLGDMIIGHYWARVIQVAAHLNIADLVSGGTNEVDTLARELNTDPWRMSRFLRIMVALGLLKKNKRNFNLTKMGQFLCRDTPGTLRNIARTQYYLFTAFSEMEEVLLKGGSGYKLSTGVAQFDAMKDMPDFAEAFDLAMNDLYVPETEALIEKYDFGQCELLMDVGGGNGEVLIQALKANPNLTGRLFDLPHVVERAASRIKSAGLEGRCELIGGSFFDPIAKKADSILLRHILHDWTEEDALLILRRCREAIKPGGVILIGEAIIADADVLTVPIRLDLAMMTLYDGAERTLDEYRELVAKVGLEITDVTSITPALSIMEARVI